MECNTCSNQSSAGIGFHCPACARAALYQFRERQAHTLVEKESLGRQVEAIVRGKVEKKTIKDAKAQSTAQITEGAKNYAYEKALAGIDESRYRIEQISRKAASLNEQMEVYRSSISEGKARAAQQRRLLEAAKKELEARSATAITSVKKAIKKTSRTHDENYEKTVAARVELCRGAADIADFRYRRRKGSDGKIVEFYSIFGCTIPNLRDLNNVPPQELTVSLNHFVRLLSLTCRYLQVRLPAEITLPHDDYPHPTIFAPASSYSERQVPFPWSSGSQSSSPAQSRTLDQKTLPRPRPLFLDRQLNVLAKEDPAAFALFVEGVSILAWDVAWLCRTQGLSVASTNWEDMCPIGRNLWQLIVGGAKEPPPLLRRTTSHSKDTPDATKGTPTTALKPGKTVVVQDQATLREHTKSPAPSLGVYSQGSAYSSRLFLNSGQCTPPAPVDLSSRNWKYSTPIRLIDKVKTHLLNDMSGAEWEVLEEQDYAFAEGEIDGDPILPGDRAEKRNSGAEKSLREAGAALEGERRLNGKTKGWMKLRTRTDET